MYQSISQLPIPKSYGNWSLNIGPPPVWQWAYCANLKKKNRCIPDVNYVQLCDNCRTDYSNTSQHTHRFIMELVKT